MKITKMALPLLTVLACLPSQVSATALIGQNLHVLSVFSNTYATTGANSSVFGSLMTGDVGTSGAGAFYFEWQVRLYRLKPAILKCCVESRVL